MLSDDESTFYEDFENICRMCLKECDVKFIRDHVVSNVFFKLTNIHFEKNDELPQQICLKCFEKINEIHDFSFLCKRSHDTLMQRLYKLKKIRVNEEMDVLEGIDEEKNYEIVFKTEEDADEMTTVENENFNLGILSNITENIKTEIVDDVIPEIINNEHNYHIPNDVHVKNDKKEETIISEPNEDSCLSNSSSSSAKDSSENNKSKTTKHKGKSYKCNICQKTFVYFKSFERHNNLFECKPKNKCKICSESFTNMEDLKCHMRVHIDEYLFECNECPRSFKKLSCLQSHMRVHTDTRVYKCFVCTKSFQGLDNFKFHMLLHNNKPPL